MLDVSIRKLEHHHYIQTTKNNHYDDDFECNSRIEKKSIASFECTLRDNSNAHCCYSKFNLKEKFLKIINFTIERKLFKLFKKNSWQHSKLSSF